MSIKSELFSKFRLAAAAAGVAGALAAGFVAPAAAQDYPTRPITILSGYAPGATTDLISRLAAGPMGAALGQTVLSDNKPGANMALAARQVVSAPADGYTILMMASAMISNLYGMLEPGYKMSDFEVIGGYTYSPFTVLVNMKTSGAKDLKELIAIGKANPGKLTFGHLGPGSPANLAANRLNSLTGIGWREVPFKSGSEAVLAVISGTVDAFFSGPSSIPNLADRPDVKMMAMSSAERLPTHPDIPTFKELGIELYDSFSYGLLVKAGTPKPIVDKLKKAFEDAKNLPEVKDKVKGIGMQMWTKSAEEFKADMDAQDKRFAADFAKLGIQKQ